MLPTVGTGGMDEIVEALGAQQAELDGLLEGLDADGWAAASPCEGWSVADVVLHLAQTNEMAIGSAEGRFDEVLGGLLAGAPPAGTVDDGAAVMVDIDPIRGDGAAVAARWREGCARLRELLRSGDRLVIAGAIGYFVFDVAALAAAFHAVGSAGLPIGLLVLAYTLGHGGAMIPIPGSAEGGLIGMFVLYGMSLPTATAAVIAYRALHAGVPMVLGVIGLADVRRLLRDPSQVT